MKFVDKELFCLTLWMLMGLVHAEQFCGYKGNLASKIEKNLDDCYAKNIIESRVRMAIGYEHCFGYNYEKLNSTVEAPFHKKLNDTSRHILHLSFKLCNDQEGVSDDFYVVDASGNSYTDFDSNDDVRTPENIKACKVFFQKILEALQIENFQIINVLGANEKLISPILPNSDERKNLFSLIQQIIRPLDECQTPMLELRTTLIKKYLKQFLIAQISPSLPSFTAQSYQVLLHPEYYIISNGQELSSNFNGEDEQPQPVNYASNILVNNRVVVLHKRTDSQALNKSQKNDVLEWDEDHQNKTPEEVEKELEDDIKNDDLSKTGKLMLTPAQKLKAGLISKDQYNKIVALPEDHTHSNNHVQIDDFWNDSLIIKKKKMNPEDFNRYSIKGFNIDQRIKKLFDNSKLLI